jgi:hypothetical protein
MSALISISIPIFKVAAQFVSWLPLCDSLEQSSGALVIEQENYDCPANSSRLLCNCW